MLTPEHWQEVERLVEAARVPPAARREAFLARECMDPEVLSEVRRKLAEDASVEWRAVDPLNPAEAIARRVNDLRALRRVLKKLAAIDPCMARAVDLHFFGGLSLAETASAVDLPLRTLERRWQATRALVQGGNRMRRAWR